jgi:hypothetical protein
MTSSGSIPAACNWVRNVLTASWSTFFARRCSQPVDHHGRCWIYRQQQCQLALIDLVDAQDAREASDHPGLVVGSKVQLVGKASAPQADHLLARPNPEVASQAIGNTARGETVEVDRFDGFLDNPSRIDGVSSKKGWLRAKDTSARQTTMHADFDGQDDWLIEINVDRYTDDVPYTRRSRATTGTGVRGKTPIHLSNAHRLGADR